MNITRNRFMKAALASVAASCLLVSLPSIPAHAAPPTSASPLVAVSTRLAESRTLRVVAFGSSSTQGAGASSDAATYPAKLQVDLASALPGVTVSVINRGIGGQDAEDFHARLPEILAEKPALVIFQTGTNDPLRGLALDRFIELTREDVTTLRKAHIDVILMEPQLCRVFTDKAGSFDFVTAVREIGAEFGIPVIRRYDLMRDWMAQHVAKPEELQAPDGLHMGDRGYALLARVVAREILDGAGRRQMVAGAD